MRTYVPGGSSAAAPTGTGFVHVTAGVEDAASKLVENADVHASAAIAPTKLALGANLSTWFTTPSSANLAAAVTDETGSGALVFANTPTLVTPTLGDATGTTIAFTGGTVHTTAKIRFPYLGAGTALIGVKDSVGTDQYQMFHSGDTITFGNTANTTTYMYGSALEFQGSPTTFKIAGTQYFGITSTAIQHTVPLTGFAAGSSTLQLGVTSITKSDATDLTLSAAQYANPQIEIGGTPGGAFNIIAPATAGTVFCLVNGTASACTIKKSAGTGVVVAANSTAWVRYSTAATDYKRSTADVVH